jgi:hypothetical protein
MRNLIVILLVLFSISGGHCQTSIYTKPPTFVDNSKYNLELIKSFESEVKRMNKEYAEKARSINLAKQEYLSNLNRSFENQVVPIYLEGIEVALIKDDEGCSSQVYNMKNKYNALLNNYNDPYHEDFQNVLTMSTELKIYIHKLKAKECKNSSNTSMQFGNNSNSIHKTTGVIVETPAFLWSDFDLKKATKIMDLSKGQKVNVIDSKINNGSWVLIEFRGYQGYMPSYKVEIR